MKSFLHLIVLLFVFTNRIQTFKLNVPKVLLPFQSSKPISFTLEANTESEAIKDLCFVWSSSRPDIVSITPIYEKQTTRFNGHECSNRALVTALSKHAQRLTSIIFVKEIKTDKLIRCDVIVDQINSIRIKHTTTHLYLEDSPESFTVEALDSEGNTFSSIDGLPFKWTIINDLNKDQESIDSRNVLRISKFIDSEYQVSDSIRQLETIGLSGHMILIEGLKTGTANVQAKLVDPFYKDNLKTPLVRLLVVANILIEPSYPVYILIGSTIKYNVFLIKQTSIEKINLPSPQYYFETHNSSIANLDESDETLSTIIGIDLGTTDLLLIDRNMKEELMLNKNLIDQKILIPPPSTQIHVVRPEQLVFTIKNWKSWILESGREYEIIVNVYSSERDLIYISENIRISTQFDKEKFQIEKKSLNGSYSLVNALNKGVTKVRASLDGTILNDKLIKFDKVIRGEQEIEILDPIDVRPKIVIFALSTSQTGSYEYQLKASGGSGSYYWQSKNTIIATISSNGLIRTSATLLGQTPILITDQLNVDIQAKSIVYVLEPIDLSILACPVETKMGQKLNLNIRMNAIINDNRDLYPVSDCSRLKFEIFIQDESVFKFIEIKSSQSEDSCAIFVLEALRIGRTSIKASVYTNDENKLTSNEMQIGSFSDLKSYKNLLTLTKDSSLTVNLFDGPIFTSNVISLVDSSTQFHYTSEVQVSDSKMVHVEPLEHDSLPNRYSYKVKCINRFDSPTQESVRVKFLVSHKKTSLNKCPIVYDYELHVRCTQPTSLELSQLFVNNDENSLSLYSNLKWKCPIKLSSNLVIANMNRNLNIQLLVKDSLNNIFDNFTSLKLDWSIENKNLLELPKLNQRLINSIELTNYESDNSLIYLPTNEDVLNSYLLFYQTFVTKSKQGTTKLTAKLYLNDKIDTENYLTTHLNIRLLDDVRIEPEQLVLFNHPSNIQTLTLSNGSGYFHAEVDNQNLSILKINQITETNVQISPYLNNGLTYLNVYDYCMPPVSLDMQRLKLENERVELRWQSSAQSQIRVAGINSILANYEDDKLEEKTSIKIYVQISDANGNLIKNKYFSLMNLNARLLNQDDEQLAQIELVESISDDNQLLSKDKDLTAIYIFKGLKSGIVNVQFEAQLDANRTNLIKSNVKEIQIFKPLKVEPKYIELIRGAEYQIQTSGGALFQSDSSSSSLSNFVYEIERLDLSKNDAIKIEQKGLINALDIGRVKVNVKQVYQSCLPFTSLSTQIDFRCESENRIQKVYSQDSLIVKVVELNSINIFVPVKSLKKGNQVPVYLLGNEKTLSPINFGSSKNLKYQWHLNDHQIASLEHLILSNDKLTTHEQENLFDQSFSLRLIAKQVGNVKLTVKVEYKTKLNEIISLTDSIDLDIFDEAKFNHFSFDQIPNNFILISPGSNFQLKTNYDKQVIDYELNFSHNNTQQNSLYCNNNTIRLSQTGLLKVDNFKLLNQHQHQHQHQPKYLHECHVSVLIKIKTNDLTKQQVLPYLIKIKPIQYSMLHVDREQIFKLSDFNLSKIRLDSKSLIKNRLYLNDAGIRLKLHVSYHDNLGDQFHAVNIHNQFRVNRNDLVEFSNLNTNLFSLLKRDEIQPVSVQTLSDENLFYLKTIKSGVFVLEQTPFSLTSTDSARDYISLNIKEFDSKYGDLLETKLDLTIGDLICLNDDNDHDQVIIKTTRSAWSSSPSNILKITQTNHLNLFSSHIAVCLNHGMTLLKKTGDSNESILSMIDINVRQIDKIKYLARNLKYISNLNDNLIHFHAESQTILNQNCSNEFELLFKSMPIKNREDLVPFKCVASLYTKSGKRLDYLDRLLITNVLYENHNWACQLKFTLNSDSLIYDLIDSHIDRPLNNEKKLLNDLYIAEEPVSIKLLIDSKFSDSSFDDMNEASLNTKIQQFTFIPSFYIQNKLIQLSIAYDSHFSLKIKASHQLSSHLIITTNIPSLIQIKPLLIQTDLNLIYDISTSEYEFNLAEYASVLQQNNGNLYVQVLCSLTQQVERIPVKFIFGPSSIETIKIRPSTKTQSNVKSLFSNIFGWKLTCSPNQITSFFFMVILFLITVLLILRIKTPSTERIASTAAVTALMTADSYRHDSPRIRDYSSFNPYRYFNQSIVTNRSSPAGMSSAEYSPSRLNLSDRSDRSRMLYQTPRLTSPERENTRLFSVD